MKIRGILWRLIVLAVGASHSVALAVAGDESWEGIPGIQGLYPGVGAIAIAGTNVYVGGIFDSIAGVSATNIAQWNGSNWRALGLGIPAGGGVNAILAQASSVYVAGNNVAVARWDGANWTPVGIGAPGGVTALASIGNDLYAGGFFNSAEGSPANHVAKWDGTNWSALGEGVLLPGDFGGDIAVVRALAVKDGELYVGGEFSSAGGQPANNIAKWDGTNWSDLAGGLPAGEVSAITIYGGKVLVAGGSTPAVRIWDGTNWSTVPQSDFLSPSALAIVGTDLYTGGFFTHVGANLANDIAKWDGTKWSALGSGVDGHVFALASNGSELWVGGYFFSAGGKPAGGLAIWHIPYSLAVARTDNLLALAWPAAGTNFVLESTGTIGPASWSGVSTSAAIHGGQCIVTNEISGHSRFYRLRRL